MAHTLAGSQPMNSAFCSIPLIFSPSFIEAERMVISTLGETSTAKGGRSSVKPYASQPVTTSGR